MFKTALFLLSSLKYDDAIMFFFDPNFLFNSGIPAISKHYRQKSAYSCLHGFSEASVPKWRFWGKIGEGVLQCWPPNELVLTLGDCYLTATFGKNQSRNATV